MIEVSSGNDETQLVYRPWTAADVKEATMHLPKVNEAGGTVFGRELQVFCRVPPHHR